MTLTRTKLLELSTGGLKRGLQRSTVFVQDIDVIDSEEVESPIPSYGHKQDQGIDNDENAAIMKVIVENQGPCEITSTPHCRV